MLRMSAVVVAGALATLFVAARATAQEPRVFSDVILLQSGEPAREHRPGCGGPNAMTAGDVILKLGAAAIDAAGGEGVATAIVDRASPEQRNWLKVRLGLHGGPSSCATACVIVPEGVTPRLEACMAEHPGWDHKACYTSASDHDLGHPHAFARVENFTRERTSTGTTVFCARGMNWSHNQNRVFRVQANW